MEFVRQLLHLRLRLLIIVLHDTLHRHSRRDHVPETRNPHLSLIRSLRAKHEQSLLRLKIEGERPVGGQAFPVDDLLWRVAVCDVPEGHDDPIFLIVSRFQLSFRRLFVAYDDASDCEVDDEIPLRVQSHLKKLDLLHELPEEALHSVLLELDRLGLHALPAPQLLIPLLY